MKANAIKSSCFRKKELRNKHNFYFAMPDALHEGSPEREAAAAEPHAFSLCCSDAFLLTLFTGSFANARSGYENFPKSEYGSLLKGCRRQEN